MALIYLEQADGSDIPNPKNGNPRVFFGFDGKVYRKMPGGAVEPYSLILSTLPGPKGDKGDQGAASTVPGPKGDKGDQGAASTVPGPKGDKGDQGAASTVPGPKGDKGDQGAASTVPGPKGDKGDQGAASTVPGPKGDKGDQGAASTVPGPPPSLANVMPIQSFTANTEYSLSIDGSVLAPLVTVRLVCTVADVGYSVGDAISFPVGTPSHAATGPEFQMHSLQSGPWKLRVPVTLPRVINRSTNALTAITAGRWNIAVYRLG